MTLGACQGHSSIASFSTLASTSHSPSAIAELLAQIVKKRFRKTYTVSQKNDTDVAHYNFNAH